MMQHLFLVTALVLSVVDAYVTSSRSAFLGRSASKAAAAAPSLYMDLETETADFTTRFQMKNVFDDAPLWSVDEAEAEHGMPWKDSIDPKVKDDELLYMPFWEWQMDFMKEHLTNLRVLPCSNGKTDFSFNENKDKKARIVSLNLASDEYRKIRLTYYDAGDNTQVFNSVWYPDPKYNLPVLGIDLLAFNRKKYLTIVDFQPIHEAEEDHASTFEHLLKPIKEDYDSLKGRMSSKFYDETQFFSQQMLFARFEDESVIQKELFPAFQAYVKTHLNLLKDCPADHDNQDKVLARQQAYDTYSAERDPATGLFAAMYGQEWAMDFVHDFLFSMSERPKEPKAAPVAGGNPFASGNPHANKGRNPHARKGGNPYAQGAPVAQKTAVVAP